MTRDELEQFRDAIDAELAGEPVQFLAGGEWCDANPAALRAHLQGSVYLWRPKPKPREWWIRLEPVKRPSLAFATKFAALDTPVEGIKAIRVREVIEDE